MENKPILLYAPIYDYVAEAFVDKMNDIPPDQEIEIYMNCPGGRVFAGWSIIGPLQKRTGKKSMCIFGHAMSMAVYVALYCDYVEALEVTQFMIHRADGYVETEDDKMLLDNINKDLRKQMESRLNMDVFQEVCGCSMDDIFKGEKRRDVMLTAKQAKKLGLIHSIKKLSQKEVEAYTEHFVAFADFSQRSEETQTSQRSEQKPNAQNSNNNSKKVNNMNLQELKAQHPELCAQLINEGHTAGVKAEQTRVKTWLAYMEVDKENVIASIKDGKDFTPDMFAEMQVKMASKATAQKIEGDSAGKITTEKPTEKTAEQKNVEAEEKLVMDGIKKIKPI